MATTVSTAFNRFLTDTVDLPATVTRSARSRRDYLTERLTRLSKSDHGFSFLKGNFIAYGSFARRTKIQPLDDIDLLVVLSDRGVRESVTQIMPITHRVIVEETKAPLAAFADDSGYVNSVLVLNQVKRALSSLHHYKKAAVKRNHQALTVSLDSHDWVFDLVPAVPVKTSQGKVNHFLIPDGSGQWMRSDPRKDAELVTKTNAYHGQRLLPVIRLLKRWNRRTVKPRIPSFTFEVFVLRSFIGCPTIESVPEAIAQFFRICPGLLRTSCPSPTGFGPDLDVGIMAETKGKVIAAMGVAEKLAKEALRHEKAGDHAKAIACWRKIFGSEFPGYG